MENTFDLLVERGFVSQTSNDDALRDALRRPMTVYCGYDPTGASLHVGHLVQVMLLANLNRAGHRVIGIVGGGTAMIPDPTGKSAMRPILTREQIVENQEGIKAQLGRYLDFAGGRALMLNNADWLLGLRYVEFLRDIGIHFTVNQLLQHETYRQRLEGHGLSFIELNYALLQAYDFLHLYREYDCRLQIGGTDQWFNILAGVELIRRVEGGEALALVSPLITTASGAKMGKTEGGAVWLDASLTSPHDFYQFWINTEDPDVGRFFRLFTFLPMEEIARYEALKGAELREAKERLAYEATAITHGEDAAREARAAARALFGGSGGSLDSVPTTTVPSGRLAAGIEVVDLLVLSALAPSKAAARRLIQQGGAYVGDRRIDDPAEREVLPRGWDGVVLHPRRPRSRGGGHAAWRWAARHPKLVGSPAGSHGSEGERRHAEVRRHAERRRADSRSRRLGPREGQEHPPAGRAPRHRLHHRLGARQRRLRRRDRLDRL
jgi:tyrosyl-tRNA synthetase